MPCLLSLPGACWGPALERERMQLGQVLDGGSASPVKERSREYCGSWCLGCKHTVILKFYSRGGDVGVGIELVSNCRGAGSWK